MTLALFFVFAALAVAGGLGVVLCRSPIRSAMSLVGTMVALAVIYLLHHAEFIFVVQLMVYAGAVMMLVVFVIMLLDVRAEGEIRGALTGSKAFGLVLGGLFFVILLVPLAAQLTGLKGDMSTDALVRIGNVEFLAGKLFGEYLLPFEIASILLLVGLVGAVTLAKKRL